MTAPLHRETVVAPEVAHRLFRRLGDLGRASRRRRQLEFLDLTARELEILGLIAHGLSNQEIADRLFLSVHTVKNHVHNLLERLRLTTRAEAAEYARARGWLERLERRDGPLKRTDRGANPLARPVGVMIVAPDRLPGDAVVAELAARPELQVIDAAASRPVAVAVDVVLLDASRRDEALAAAWRVGEELPGASLLVFGLAREDEELLDFVEAGALGYLLDGASAPDLAAAIQDLHAGRTHCAPHIAAAALARIEGLDRQKSPPGGDPREPLTGREQEILRLLAAGLSNKEIGKRLAISLSTVKNHVHNLLGKLAVRRRRDAIRQAYAQGLLPDLLDRPRRP